MKILSLLALFILLGVALPAQRRVPAQSREAKNVEKLQQKQEREAKGKDESRWLQNPLNPKSSGVPEISAWHTGTAGVIPSDAAELSLFNPSRIGFTKKTELLFRIGEEWLLPNAGLKHAWWRNDRFALSTEHTLYYTYPMLRILQKTGFKDLVPDSVKVNHGLAMRNELLFSWLLNPREFGCPDLSPEKILTFRAGAEFYAGFGDTEVKPFDYFHSLYHTQLFDRKVLYYGGLQFDSYFSSRFHYSLNALYYNVDISREYAVEANLRLTCYVSRRVGISASCKAAYMDVAGKTGIACLPLLDITYLVNPGRGAIRHGLYKNKRKKW